MALRGSRFRDRYGKLGVKPKFPFRLGVFREYFASGTLFSSQDYNSGDATPYDYERIWDEVHPGPPWKSGGPFSKVKVYYPLFQVKGSGKRRFQANPNSSIFEYVGGHSLPNTAFDQFTPAQLLSAGFGQGFDSTMIPSIDPYLSDAWQRLRPQIERAGAAQFLAEMRDVPRQLRTTAKGLHDIWRRLGGSKTSHILAPKKVADHYLNHVFGWVPFVNDIVKMTDAVLYSQQYISQLKRDNNSWIKRVRTFANTEADEYLGGGGGPGCQPGIPSQLGNNITHVPSGQVGFGYFDVRRRRSTVVWAEGSFKYYRPEFDVSLEPDGESAFTKMQQYLTVTGLRMNPSVLYKITPWTWLIDWFSNVGDQVDIHNDILIDSMVSRYMFVMQHRADSIRSTHLLNYKSGAEVITFDRLVESKQRVPAETPYGFGLQWNGLSPRQLAILAALGITRS